MNANQVLDNPQKVFDYMCFFKAISPKKIVFISESSRDGQVLQELVNGNYHDKVNIIYGNGKPTCLEASKLAHDNNLEGCAALVDADFDNIEIEKYTYPVILTDYHDLEGYAIFSDSWERTLREFLNTSKLKERKLSLTALRDKCVDICLPLGVTLLINNNMELGIDFKEYCFGKKCKIDYKNYKNDIDNLIERLYQLNSKKIIDKHKIKNAYNIEEQIISNQKKHQYISSSMICKCVIELSKQEGLFHREVVQNTFNEITLLRIFRSHISSAYLEQSNMYSRMKNFINNN